MKMKILFFLNLLSTAAVGSFSVITCVFHEKGGLLFLSVLATAAAIIFDISYRFKKVKLFLIIKLVCFLYISFIVFFLDSIFEFDLREWLISMSDFDYLVLMGLMALVLYYTYAAFGGVFIHKEKQTAPTERN